MNPQGADATTLDDEGEYPYAQDLNGVWHRRPDGDSLWTPAPAETQCATVCGSRIGSVHVSEFDPRELQFDKDESACGQCFPEPLKES